MKQQILMHLDQVTKQYPMGDVVVDALMGVTMEVYDGELLVIVGPSGSGKSTMLNLLGGMDQPTGGRLFFGEQELSSVSEQQLTLYRRLQVGFVFQFYNLIPDLTAAENIALTAQLVTNPLPVEDVLRQVGLLDRAHHFPSQLSGGEQQRIAIARAVVKKPRLLLCDEPTGALDYQTGKKILGLLEKVNREMESTVIIVTHNTAITNMAQRVVRMRSGRIAELFRNEEPWPPERIEW